MSRLADIAEAFRYRAGAVIDGLMRDPMSAFYFEIELDGCVGLIDDMNDAALPAVASASGTAAR